MKYRGFLVFIFILNSLLGYSQKIFREGFVIKNSGDTLSGLVQFEVKQGVPKNCIFKRFDIANVVMYSPENIIAFGYKNGNYYESRIINGEKYFVECLINGKLRLFKLSSRLFVAKENTDLTELKNESIKAKKDNKEYEYSNLNDFMLDQTNDVAGVQIPYKLRVEGSDLMQVIKEYNTKSNEQYIVYNRGYDPSIFSEATIHSGKKQLGYGFLSGISINTATLNTTTTNYYVGASSVNVNHSSLSVGAFCNYQISRVSNKWFIQSEIIFSKQKSYFYNIYNLRLLDQRESLEMNTEISSIKLPIYVSYNFKLGSVASFLNIGVVYNIDKIYYGDARLEVQGLNNPIYLYEGDKAFQKMNTKYLNYLLGFGVKYSILGNRYISLEARYELGKGLTQAFGFNYYPVPKFEVTQNKPRFQFIVGIGL